MLKKILFLLLLLFVVSTHARPGFLEGLGLTDGDNTPPLAENAFQFHAKVNGPNSLSISFAVMEGNYLYKDKIQFSIVDNPQVHIRDYQLPAGNYKMDETFGLSEVYHHDINTTLTLSRPESAQNMTFKARYQGCSERFGICYPPIETSVALTLVAISRTETTVPAKTNVKQVMVSEQDRIARTLAEDSLAQILFGFLGLGLLLAFTPCIFPMIPILSSIIVGEGEQITTRRAFILSLIYVLAMSVTYTAAGILTGLLGENLQTMLQTPWLIYSFSALFIILAISMFGLFELQLPYRLQHHLHQISHRQQGGHFAGVALMGLLSGLIVGPCLAPPLAGALIFIGQSADPLLGGAALFALSIGMGIPLLVIGTSAGSLLPKAGDWMNTIKAIFGVLLLGLAIWMLDRVIADWLTLMLWGALFIISAVYMGAFDHLHIDASGWDRFWKGLGLLLLIYGCLLLIGGASGSRNPWKPLQELADNRQTPIRHRSVFTRINNLAELETHLAQSSKPVLLDFYADWCTDCKTMKNTTFQHASVLTLLQNFTCLQLDMTENNAAHHAMLKHFAVFGPPTMLFFDENGQELHDYRLVGKIDAATMQQHLKQINKQ